MSKKTQAPEAPLKQLSNFEEQVKTFIWSGSACCAVNTAEHIQLADTLRNVLDEEKITLITWSCGSGFGDGAPEAVLKDKASVQRADRALEAILDPKSPFRDIRAAFLMQDLDYFTRVDPRVAALLRDAITGLQLFNPSTCHPIIIRSHNLQLSPIVQPHITQLNFPLPDEERLGHVVDFLVEAQRNHNPDIKLEPAARERLIQEGRGLPGFCFEEALARCVAVEYDLNKPVCLDRVRREKAQILEKDQVLTFIPKEKQTERKHIGGFDLFMPWAEERALAYTKEAQAENIDLPRGAAIIGPPGTGKSTVGKALGGVLGLPTVYMDITAVFGRYVGESEGRLREALATVTALQGCVLVIDEIDKSLGGAHLGSGDSGPTQKVFSQILNWLVEGRGRTFPIVTLNSAERLPPEFFRRFDAVWSTALPHPAERRRILEIHLEKRGVDPAGLDFGEPEWDELVKITNGFAGSELEDLVRDARYTCFAAHRHGRPSFETFLKAGKAIKPVSVLDPESIKATEKFCADRVRPVSSPPPSKGSRRSRELHGGGADNN